MAQYLSPGVYVEEIPSAVQAIAGVGTSTAGFVGIVPDNLRIPLPNPYFYAGAGDEKVEAITLPNSVEDLLGLQLAQDVTWSDAPADGASPEQPAPAPNAEKPTPDPNAEQPAKDPNPNAPGSGTAVAPGQDAALAATGKTHTIANGTVISNTTLAQQVHAAVAAGSQIKVLSYAVISVVPDARKLVGVKLAEDVTAGSTKYAKDTLVADAAAAAAIVAAKKAQTDPKAQKLQIRNTPFVFVDVQLTVDAGVVKLCTNFSEFRRYFGGFSTDLGQRQLAHAVYGFFNNGGTRCFVGRVRSSGEIPDALEQFAAVDEIALMAAPGITDPSVRDALVTHCAIKTQDRFALLDSVLDLKDDDLQELARGGDAVPSDSDYAAFYFPWLKVFDPVTKLFDPTGDGSIFVPPTGHVAGIYARTDTTRGVFKAPANAPVMGALDLRYQISKAQQDGLNPQGVNCIRNFAGNIKVWGARTIGGDANGEWCYINVRRTFLFLRESIEEGLQWAVFEPNDQALWAKITRNVSAFLTIQWRAGALFGATPQQAFYVKCDAETNRPDLRELGQVVTEIGVAVVRPAEFVIFRISQWQAPEK